MCKIVIVPPLGDAIRFDSSKLVACLLVHVLMKKGSCLVDMRDI